MLLQRTILTLLACIVYVLALFGTANNFDFKVGATSVPTTIYLDSLFEGALNRTLSTDCTSGCGGTQESMQLLFEGSKKDEWVAVFENHNPEATQIWRELDIATFGRLGDGSLQPELIEDIAVAGQTSELGTYFLGGGDALVKVRAWEALYSRNVPDALRLNVQLLSRLSDKPNVINFIDNLTGAGRTSLASNVDEWIMHFDAREYLRVGDISSALNKLEGTLGSSFTGPNGVRYIDEAFSVSGNPNAVYSKYDNIITDEADISLIAQRLQTDFPGSNLSELERIIADAKKHLFVDEHLVPTGNGIWKQGRFSPQEFIADDWLKVRNGNYSPDEIDRVRKLIAHEYVESKLMKEGITFRGRTVSPTTTSHGAHDLSVNEQQFSV